MAMYRETIVVTASGSAGAATGTATSERTVHGIIVGVHLARTTTPVATTDVLVKERRTPGHKVLEVADLAADNWYYPTRPVHSNVDGSEVEGSRDYVTVKDVLEVTVEGANEGSVVTVTIDWEPTN